jgi:hypothetical protein
LATFGLRVTNLFAFLHRFNPLQKAAEDAIARISKVISIKRKIYFINKGIARIYYYKDGNDVTESFSFENNVIARVESLFSGRPTRKAIQVLEDTELVAINSVKLFELYDSFPEIERLFRKIFWNRRTVCL